MAEQNNHKYFNPDNWISELKDCLDYDINEEMNDSGKVCYDITGIKINYDEFREKYKKKLLDSTGIYLPFGKKIKFKEFNKFLDSLSSFNISFKYDDWNKSVKVVLPQRSDCTIDLKKFSYGQTISMDEYNKFSETKSKQDKIALQNKIKIVFPTIDDFPDSLCNRIFDQYGLQTGEVYDNEYQNYKDLDIDAYTQIQKIKTIKSKVAQTPDILVKKSLIFSAFVTVETYVRAVISKKLPDTSTIEDPNYKKIIETYINQKLITRDGRKELFKIAYDTNQQLSEIDNIELRDELAHNIDGPKLDLNNNMISYNLIKKENHQWINEPKELSINDIFDSLIHYVNKLDNFLTDLEAIF